MAKRTKAGRPRVQEAGPQDPNEPIGPRHDAGGMAAADPTATAADALGDFAADLGTFLGQVQSRASSWLDQRKTIADQLLQIRDTANQYLKQLGHGGAEAAERLAARAVTKVRRGRPAGTRKRKVTMSPEARERIAAAQRRRWAKVRKAQQDKGE